MNKTILFKSSHFLMGNKENEHVEKQNVGISESGMGGVGRDSSLKHQHASRNLKDENAFGILCTEKNIPGTKNSHENRRWEGGFTYLRSRR